MQTVNFNCPHCGNLMAVGTNLLGRNVRCPHCKNVVRAPAGDPTAAAGVPTPQVVPPAPPHSGATQPVQVPKFEMPPQVEHHESIFGERHEEDVFGSEPLKPTMPSAAPPPRPLPAGLQQTVGMTASPPPPVPKPTVELLPPGYDDRPGALRESPGDARDTSSDDEPAPSRYRARPDREDGGSTGAFAWILLGYGAFATIIACFFAFQYFTAGSSKHPFEAIPDAYGQYEKANRKQVSFKGFPDPKAEVPQELRVKLGGELAVGDLQVKPVSIDRQKLSRTLRRAVEGDEERPLGRETLVLKLRVKNLSADTAFHPNDPAFNRAIDKATPVPYTALEFRNAFHYGPLPWPDTSYDDHFIVGFGLEKDAAPLAPGAEADVFVAVAAPGSRPDVNSFDGVMLNLKPDAYKGESFLWRVQLRRGLVKTELDGKEVEMSATTVIGVPFTAADVKY